MKNLNGIGVVNGAIEALTRVVEELEQSKHELEMMKQKIESEISSAAYSRAVVSVEIAKLKGLLHAPQQKVTTNECEAVETLTNGGGAIVRSVLYDVNNCAHYTTPRAVFTDRVSLVYVKTVEGVPVHDVIEIERVDVNGTAHTFKGHGVQARNGKWYEHFAIDEWELVIAEDVESAGNEKGHGVE